MKTLFVLALVVAGFLGTAKAADKIPAGFVATFNLSACPTGFSPVTDAPGRFLVGVGTLGADTYTLAGTGGEARHVLTLAELPSGNQVVKVGNNGTTSPSASWNAGSPLPMMAGHTDTSSWSGYHFPFPIGGSGAAHENRPPYLAMLVCSLDADFTGGGMDPELFIWAIVCLCFAAGVIAGQQR